MIGMAHNFLQQAIYESPSKPSVTPPKISRVLLEDARVNKITEEPRRNLICKGCPEALPVTFSALAVSRELIVGLAQASLCGGNSYSYRIERCFCEQAKFSTRCQRRGVHAIGGAKARHDAKGSLRLLFRFRLLFPLHLAF